VRVDEHADVLVIAESAAELSGAARVDSKAQAFDHDREP
jgi:hypothetical protein